MDFPPIDRPNAGVQRRQELVDAGDPHAAGGRGRQRPEPEQTLLTTTELKERAQKEIQRQLGHKDPKIRRDAAKAALEMTDGKYATEKGARAVIYLTAALNDGPDTVEELERLAAEAEQAARDQYGVPSGV